MVGNNFEYLFSDFLRIRGYPDIYFQSGVLGILGVFEHFGAFGDYLCDLGYLTTIGSKQSF